MTPEERKRKQNAKRAQTLRDKRKASGNHDLRISLNEQEQSKLDDICAFFAYPAEPYAQEEALQSLIHRVHAEIPKIETKLGKCSKCGEQLPQGCAKLREGGLFKGDATCWHTINRIRIYQPQMEL
ncbi:hypothetical protein [Vibrio coralliilyticus]|uniref:hypothetical protein n=1 Tax=Vibrio coralliilyticus TaxID=190893 RepID=UPI001E5002C3|nr:hypothetical protein [Vibrio coralliilyticus]MCC2521046.1 hypothetical protein [Vibrio coralliilyticus]